MMDPGGLPAAPLPPPPTAQVERRSLYEMYENNPVVPVAERTQAMWLEVKCGQCGEGIMFPWAGYELVACERCGATESTERAYSVPPPSAAMQIRAAVALQKQQEMEQNGGSIHQRHAEMAKRTMKRFGWMLSLGDTVERTLFGKPIRYGKLKVYLKGRIILPPSSGFILFPMFLMFTPYLTLLHVIPHSPAVDPYAHVFIALGVASIFVAQWTEPGVVPRQPEQPPKDDLHETVNGMDVERKWCKTCNIHRPARASHCSTCDVCVMNFDHHCHITGTCVGARNLRPFYAFLIFTTLAAATVGSTAVGCLVAGNPQFAAALAVTVWCFLGFLLVFLMFLGLSMVMSLGMTGREHKKMIYAPGQNPFDKGSPARNVYPFLCSFIPSLIAGKEALLKQEGDSAALV